MRFKEEGPEREIEKGKERERERDFSIEISTVIESCFTRSALLRVFLTNTLSLPWWGRYSNLLKTNDCLL